MKKYAFNIVDTLFLQILTTMDRSLYVYDKPGGCSQTCFCMFCFSDSQNQELLTCSVCMDW